MPTSANAVTATMRRFLIDTSALNHIVDQQVDPAALVRLGVCITHVQADELSATSREDRRASLVAALNRVEAVRVPTSAAVWNESKWDEAEWGDADGMYAAFLAALDARNGGRSNNSKDALIGVTALARDMVLVTDDRD